MYVGGRQEPKPTVFAKGNPTFFKVLIDRLSGFDYFKVHNLLIEMGV